jgi:hypothetical protein
MVSSADRAFDHLAIVDLAESDGNRFSTGARIGLWPSVASSVDTPDRSKHRVWDYSLFVVEKIWDCVPQPGAYLRLSSRSLSMTAYGLPHIIQDQTFRYRRFACIVIPKRRYPNELGE